MNAMWPHWVYSNGMNLLSVSNVQVTGLGLACFIPALADPANNLLSNLLLVPILTLILLTFLCLARFLPPFQPIIATILIYWRWCTNMGYSVVPVETEETVRVEVEEFPVRENDEEAEEEGRGGHNSEEVEVALGTGVINDYEDDDEDEDGTKEKNRIGLRHWGLYIWLYILYFLYYGLANRALEVFNCNEEPITRTRYLQQTPWLECSLYVLTPHTQQNTTHTRTTHNRTQHKLTLPT